MISDLIQLSDEELKKYFGYSNEECDKMRKAYDASIYPEKYSDQELSALGFSEEEINNLRRQSK